MKPAVLSMDLEASVATMSVNCKVLVLLNFILVQDAVIKKIVRPTQCATWLLWKSLILHQFVKNVTDLKPFILSLAITVDGDVNLAVLKQISNGERITPTKTMQSTESV